MKKILLLFSFMLAYFINAQVSSYTFVQSSGTYTPITGATVIATATNGNSLDDTIYPVTLPFPFSFNGTNFSAVNVSTNGYLTFGATAPGSTDYSPISINTPYAGAVSAFGRDLNSVFNIAATTGDISWAVVGTAPNREIVIQWSNFRPAYSTSTTTVYTLSFQIRLRETSSTIAVVYKSGSYLAGTTSINNTIQVGLRGASNADFNNRLNATTLAFGSSNAGTANGSTQAYNTTAATPGMPANGLTYTWTPPSCFAPSGLNATAVTPTSATINWTAPSTAPSGGYDVYYTTSATPPTVGTTPSQTVPTGTSATISPLAPSTTYYVWVRSRCGGTQSAWTSMTVITLCVPVTVLPWTENFDTMTTLGSGILPVCWKQVTGTNAWNSSNETASNSSPGPRSTPNYVRVQWGNTNASQLWTPGIALTAGTTYEFSFYYHTGGTDTSNIGFTGNVLVNTSQSSTGATNLGTFITATQGTANYTQYKVYYTPATTGAYSFAVNVSSTFAPWFLGVDDFRLRIAPTCIEPLGLVAVSSTGNTATVSWNPPTTQPANGYQIYYSTTTTPPVTPQITGIPGTAVSHTIPGLNPSTTYYVWVRAICSATDQSDLSDPVSIMTTQIPAVLPYTQNFTGGNDLGLLNGTQTNKWVRGNATGNPAQSLYISNDNGVTNAYTHTTSTVHAYRDIQIPAGTTLASFSFDWKSQGENNWDYIRVWLLPSNVMPVAGAQIVAGTNRVQVGQYQLQGTVWQNFSNPNLNLTAYAGGVMRLVFEWRNDGGGGTQPPGAIDNIVLRVCSNATPVVTVTPASITHNAATITWPQDIGGASYQIRYRPVGSTQWLPTTGPITVAAVLTPNNTYTFPQNLLPYTQYEVEVAAVCNTTNVGVFSHNEFMTKCDPTPPNVTVTSITPTSALVTWNPLAAGANYELRWKLVTDPATSWQSPPPPGTPQPPLNSYTITGLSSYKTYEVQVRNKCIGSLTFNPWSTSQVFTTVRVCEIPPPGLTITQLNPTSAEVVWDAYTGPGATNNYILRYRKVGLPGWTNVNVNNNTYTITGLLELTKYEMQVANVCTGTPGNYTPEYYFTTPTVVYCPMHSTNFASEFISKVTAKPAGKPEMINITAGSAYSDFTAVPLKYIDMVQGSVGNQIIVDKTLSSGAKAGVAVWIDFNRNGTFDLDERILADGPNTNLTASATFTVPADAFIGSTDKYVVMRVALAKDAIPVNCISFTDGEVEDYTVRISKLPAVNTLNQTDILIYPNPVKSILNVKNVSKKAKYKIYSAAGQIISSGIILNNKIDVSRLINGLYVIDIDDVQGTAQRKFIKE
ncbi:fibronectin type III domain-containing protein [Chryseobacterium scophthalmum]|uniref:fibronectin type III domain-containing protein n=1 Tax=Chryseobacterium scophthalmum TaxID=59733 RepID=UPI003CFD33C2